MPTNNSSLIQINLEMKHYCLYLCELTMNAYFDLNDLTLAMNYVVILIYFEIKEYLKSILSSQNVSLEKKEISKIF
jgi:hypothetical protein